MSFFLDILRWIFGGKPIDQRKEEDVEEYILTCYGSRFPHSIYASNNTLMISQYDAQVHRENYWNSSFKFPQTSITPTVHTSRGSTCNTNSQSYVSQCKASFTNPVITKPSEQGSQPNSSPFSSKPSSSLSEPSAYVSQSEASNPVITKPSEQGSQPNSSPFSSKPSSSLSEPSAYVSQSEASNPVITKPSEQGSQPNSSPFSSKPSSSLSEPSAYVSQSKASNPVITKPSEQGSQPNSSKPSSSLSEPSAYVSQSKASNPVITKPSEHGSQPNSSRFSSKLSSSLSEPSAYVSQSKASNPVITKPSEQGSQPNSSKPFSSLSEPSAYVSQSKASNPVITKPSEQGSQPNSSKPSSSLSEPSAYVSQSKASNPVITKPSEQGSQLNSSKPSSSLSEPSAYVSQSKASNPVITKPSEQGSQPNSARFSSKPSSSLSEPSPYVSQSKASNPVITKPSEQGSQPNSSRFSSKSFSSLFEPSAYVSQSKASNPVITKPSEQGSQPNSSRFSSKSFSSLFEPSAYVSQSKASNPVITKPSEQGSQPNSSRFSSQPSSSSSKPSSSLFEPSAYSSKQSRCLSGSGLHQLIPKPTPTSPSTSSSPGTPSSSLKPPPPFTKPTLSLASPNQNNQQTKTNYFWVEKGAPPIYVPPAHIKDSIKNDIVPGILKKPLSTPTYKDYFGALLYAEDYYFEKWDEFEMKNVTLELHEAAIYTKKGKYKDLNKFDEKVDKIFVAFEIDSVPERRPFFLSRDFAFVRPSGRKVEPFQGFVYRVVKRNLVLVEFGEDFHYQHDSACKYDVKFSFNRACLKRAYQAIAAASDSLFQNFLFPRVPRNSLSSFQVLPRSHKLDREQVSAVQQILSLDSTPPYLLEGSLSVVGSEQLSRTGMVVQEAVIQIYRNSPSCRILMCAPINRTCDVLMRCLKKEIPESKMFRANAAFRELDGVPFDILPSCLYKGECFSCPSLQELRKFKVILSTFMSSYLLHGEGIVAGDFSHIFLVDASSATEPETLVTLANLANEKTAVVISGAPSNHSGWVRSKIARENGLMTSYFERLRESKLYKSLDPKLITQLQD